MKKVMFCALALLIFCAFGWAYSAGEPEWSEFCPACYLNEKVLDQQEIEEQAKILADKKTKVFYCKSDSTIAKVIRGITVLPACDCWCANKIAKSTFRNELQKRNEVVAYWLDRKKVFEKELSSCSNLSNDAKGMCYLKIREIEHQKNDNLKMQQRLRGIETQIFLHSFYDSLK